MTDDTQPLFIMIEGPAGSGKSTLCLDLQIAFSECAFVDSDLLKIRSFNCVDHKSCRTTARWRRELADRVAIFWCSQLCRVGRPIIMECCDTFMGHNTISRMCRRYKYRLLRFLLLPSLSECWTRVSARNDRRLSYPLSRHKVDRSHRHFSRRRNTGEYLCVCDTHAELHVLLNEVLHNRRRQSVAMPALRPRNVRKLHDRTKR